MYVLDFLTELQNTEIYPVTLPRSDSTTDAFPVISKILGTLTETELTRRNVSGMSRRHRFFLFTDIFLKCRFHSKVEIISTFSLRTNVAFFLNQLFLCIHVNK